MTLGTGAGSSSYATDTATFSLSTEGTDDVPTIHFAHQPVTGESTLIARVQSLDAIDQAAAAGLMIREDTSPESAYAFLALTPQGIRFESRQGGSTEVAHVMGSSASAPVWLKLERKEGSIYAYESGDGVNWVVVSSIVLASTTFNQIGISATASNSEAIAQLSRVTVSNQGGGESELTTVPFTIESEDFENPTTLLSLFEEVPVLGTQALQVSGDFTDIILKNDRGEPIGYDVFIPDVKESIVFNAENTVKAIAFMDVDLNRWPNEHRFALYSRFEQDPSFDEIVQKVHEAKGLKFTNAVLIAEVEQLMQRVAEQYLLDEGIIEDPQGNLETESITATSVRQPFVWLSESISLSQDGNAITVGANNLLAFRVFVYKVGEAPNDLNDLSNNLVVDATKDFIGRPHFYGNVVSNPLDKTRETVLELNADNNSYDPCGVYEVALPAATPFSTPGSILNNPRLVNGLDIIDRLLQLFIQGRGLDIEKQDAATLKRLGDFTNAVLTTQFIAELKGYRDAGDNAGLAYAAGQKMIEEIANYGLDEFFHIDPEAYTNLDAVAKRFADRAIIGKTLAEAGSILLDTVTYLSAIANENNGDFPKAYFSTGDPEIAVEPKDESSLLGVAPADIPATFIVRNTGCRPADIKLEHGISTTVEGEVINPDITTLHSLPGETQEGIDPSQAKMEVQTNIHCEENELGQVRFPVHIFDPELPEGSLNKQYESQQQLYDVNCQDVKFKFLVNGIELENFALPTLDGSEHVPDRGRASEHVQPDDATNSSPVHTLLSFGDLRPSQHRTEAA